MLATERMTEPRVDVDAWGHPGLPHIRLDHTVVDAEALHYSSVIEKGTRKSASCSTRRENQGEQVMDTRKEESELRASRCSSVGRFGPELDTLLRKLTGYKRAIGKAQGRDCGRPIQEWRKLLSIALARYAAATILSATGHKAMRGK